MSSSSFVHIHIIASSRIGRNSAPVRGRTTFSSRSLLSKLKVHSGGQNHDRSMTVTMMATTTRRGRRRRRRPTKKAGLDAAMVVILLLAGFVVVLAWSPPLVKSFVLTPSQPLMTMILPNGAIRRTGASSITRTCTRLHVLPSSFYYGDGSSPPSSSPGGARSPRWSNKNATDFQTALAIVPPLPDWDRLQRARHFARDKLFHKWPPAIRLFHPFPTTSTTNGGAGSGASALDVAQVVEELELEPFEITLDTWVIVPHLEAVEAAWMTSETVTPIDDDNDNEDNSMDWEYYDTQRQEDAEIRKLIEEEERIGLEKAQARKERLAQSKAAKAAAKIRKQHDSSVDGDKDDTEDDNNGDYDHRPSASSDPSRMFEEQQQQFEDFGGPCLLCLEPNSESKQLLQELREELALLLLGKNDSDGAGDGDGDDQTTKTSGYYSSPSSIYSWNYIREPMFQPDEYRPLIPIASFESLHPAMQVARRLKGLWGEPLTFQVNDLHILSCRDDYGEDLEQIRDMENVDGYKFSPESVNEWMEQPWGCNAKIMLMGQEQDTQDGDDDDDGGEDGKGSIAKQIQLLLEEGQVGGNDISNDYTILDDEEEINASDIEMWLDNDDDWDEGMQVVIGRTHFFTGDQRNYRGMPASSAVDSKDRSMGDSSRVSGLARRRRTTTRSGYNQWENGEYGRRDADYLPWTKKERSTKRVERLLDDYSPGNRGKKRADEVSEDEIIW